MGRQQPLFLLALLLCSCHDANIAPRAERPQAPPLNVAVPQIADPVKRSSAEMKAAREVLAAFNARFDPNQWQAVYVSVTQHLDSAEQANNETLNKIGVAVESVKEDAKADAKQAATITRQDVKIKQLEGADAVRTWLQRIGGALILASIAVSVASFFYPAMAPFRPLALAAGITGAVAITLARFLPVIEWTILSTLGAAFAIALTYVGWYVWRHQADWRRWIQEEHAAATGAKPS